MWKSVVFSKKYRNSGRGLKDNHTLKSPTKFSSILYSFSFKSEMFKKTTDIIHKLIKA